MLIVIYLNEQKVTCFHQKFALFSKTYMAGILEG